MYTCKHIVSQTAVDPQLPSSPSMTSRGMRTLKYNSHTLGLMFIESAMGCNTYSHMINDFVSTFSI